MLSLLNKSSEQNKIYKAQGKFNFMDLVKIAHKKVDVNLLKDLSSLLSANKMIHKFEKYYGKIPIEQDFYKAYLKYIECKNFHGKVFNLCGTIRKSVPPYLNSPKFKLKQFQVIEDYLFQKKIINEKIFEADK